MNKPAVSQAKLQRAMRVLEKAGKPFCGFRLHPDGSVDVLTGQPDAALTSDPLDAELHQWAAKHGYG